MHLLKPPPVTANQVTADINTDGEGLHLDKRATLFFVTAQQITRVYTEDGFAKFTTRVNTQKKKYMLLSEATRSIGALPFAVDKRRKRCQNRHCFSENAVRTGIVFPKTLSEPALFFRKRCQNRHCFSENAVRTGIVFPENAVRTGIVFLKTLSEPALFFRKRCQNRHCFSENAVRTGIVFPKMLSEPALFFQKRCQNRH